MVEFQRDSEDIHFIYHLFDKAASNMKIYSAKKTIFDEPVGRGEYFLRGWINLIFDNAESNKWFIVNVLG